MGTLRVLLVDSHESSRTLLSRLLRMSGFEVAVVTTQAEAEALAAGSRFDWLISEISPPHRPEFPLMRQLRDRHATRGILLTAHDLRWARGWRQAGFSHVLRKPLEYDRLLAKLRRFRNVNPVADSLTQQTVEPSRAGHPGRIDSAMFRPAATLN